MIVKFRIRRDTAANWTSANPVLALGEPGLETDTRRVKYGDGATAWNSLSYSRGSVAWGQITGTLSDQTDLQSALDAKQNTITAAALTKTDDTNVTLTLGGSPSTALLAAASLTLGWTGQLSVARGGTGVSSSTGTGSVVLGTAPTFTTSVSLSSTTTANINFTSDSAGAPKTGLFQLDASGNMVFRQSTSGSMFFDFQSAANFRNSSFTNVFAISSAGVTSILGNVTPKTNDGAALGTSSLGWADLFLASGGVVNFANGNATLTHSTGKVASNVPLQIPSYTVAGVPAATIGAGSIIFVSNESGGAVLAFSDGTDWRRVTDRAVIS